MSKIIYKIEVELDTDTPPLTDTRVADMMRQVFYDTTRLYIEQIHASVSVEAQSGTLAGIPADYAESAE